MTEHDDPYDCVDISLNVARRFWHTKIHCNWWRLSEVINNVVMCVVEPFIRRLCIY